MTIPLPAADDLARDLAADYEWSDGLADYKWQLSAQARAAWRAAIRRASLAERIAQNLEGELAALRRALFAEIDRTAQLESQLYSARQALEAIHEGGLPCRS